MERSDKFRDWGIAILRIAIGGIFVAHGAQKLFVYGLSGVEGFMSQAGIPFPWLSALAVTATEFFGGLALVAGVFTRWSAMPLAFAMFVAVTAVHLKGGFFLPDGVEYALTLMLASIALVFTGSGALSVDKMVVRRKKAAATPMAVPSTAVEVPV